LHWNIFSAFWRYLHSFCLLLSNLNLRRLVHAMCSNGPLPPSVCMTPDSEVHVILDSSRDSEIAWMTSKQICACSKSPLTPEETFQINMLPPAEAEIRRHPGKNATAVTVLWCPCSGFPQPRQHEAYLDDGVFRFPETYLRDRHRPGPLWHRI